MKNVVLKTKWMLCDVISILAGFLLSVFVLDDFSISKTADHLVLLKWYDAVIIVGVFLAFGVFTKMYRIMWRYADIKNYVNLLSVCLIDVISLAAVIGVHHISVSLSLYFLFFLMLSIFTCGSRIIFRHVLHARELHQKVISVNHDEIAGSMKKERLMIIGAGNAASILIDDMKKNVAFLNTEIVCAIDDNEAFLGRSICGVKVMGTRHDIVSLSKRMGIDTIVFAIPSLVESERAEILKICSETGCKLKTMPSVNDMIENSDKSLSLKKVEIEDLLDRLPIKIDIQKLIGYIEGKTILVTGGGGSIGSELCRQIAANKPGKLIIFDVYENNAYDIQHDLKKEHAELDLVTLIGDVSAAERMASVFKTYKPDIVYHAAAHKHVPLMEDSPNEAIKNNVFGTLKTAICADRHGAARFVLISTDKAVNPTNVMGASKRICEMVVQMMSRRSKTEFVAVRFGNVLGSNGSVIPLFRKQIEQGGPVLVTHPDIIRYFMTIPEAVSLVLTAGAMAKGGEIFVLDMGKPVKIVDLAKNMIRLMGYRVDKDIKIEFVGLRPGEKLFEEMLMDEEGLRETDNHLIHIGNPLEFDDDWFMDKLEQLKSVMYDDGADVRELIHELVPTYKLPKKAE